MTPSTLCAEKRKRVAEAAQPGYGWRLLGCLVRQGESPFYWEPERNHVQYRDLTQTTARLIEAIPESDKDYAPDPRKHYDPLFRHAIATGDVNALEQLCADLLETTE